MRNGVKRPTQLAGSGVVSANIAWGRRESLGVAATEYHQVLVDDAWSGEIYRLRRDRKSTRLNSSHQIISYAVFCLKKKISIRATAPQVPTRFPCAPSTVPLARDGPSTFGTAHRSSVTRTTSRCPFPSPF